MQITQERLRELLKDAFIAGFQECRNGTWINIGGFDEYIEDNEKTIPELLDFS